MRFTPEHVLEAAEAVLENIPENYQSPDPVTFLIPVEKLNRLREVVEQSRRSNARARDIKTLAGLVATTSQNAANPRPLAALLSNAVDTVMADGGNPAYQVSPLVRLVLHHLLWLLDQSSLPYYDREPASAYSDDLRAAEELGEVVASV